MADQIKERMSAIEDEIAAGRMDAPQVFTKMRELLSLSSSTGTITFERERVAQFKCTLDALLDARTNKRTPAHLVPTPNAFVVTCEMTRDWLKQLLASSDGRTANG